MFLNKRKFPIANSFAVRKDIFYSHQARKNLINVPLNIYEDYIVYNWLTIFRFNDILL